MAPYPLFILRHRHSTVRPEIYSRTWDIECGSYLECRKYLALSCKPTIQLEVIPKGMLVLWLCKRRTLSSDIQLSLPMLMATDYVSLSNLQKRYQTLCETLYIINKLILLVNSACKIFAFPLLL